MNIIIFRVQIWFQFGARCDDDDHDHDQNERDSLNHLGADVSEIGIPFCLIDLFSELFLIWKIKDAIKLIWFFAFQKIKAI